LVSDFGTPENRYQQIRHKACSERLFSAGKRPPGNEPGAGFRTFMARGSQ
jgi:hypothetical protein